MGDVRSPVHWTSADKEYSLVEVLPANATHHVVLVHVTAHDMTIDSLDKIGKPVDADNVTITFIDASGLELRWRRTGTGEPVRIVHPPPGRSEHGPGLAAGALGLY